MGGELFRAIDQMTEGEPADSVLSFLTEEFRKQKNFPLLFEATLMKRRLELGLPLIQTDDFSSYPEPIRRAYEQAMVEAARQTGRLFLAEGDIESAWPYFRAIGEPQPVAEAIERLQPGEETDAIIEIAFEQGVHPAKGLELILERAGMCRALTCFGMYGGGRHRQQCIGLLIRRLHAELVNSLRSAIETEEGRAPEPAPIPSLIEGRDWLFGEWNAYVDTSHLMSVVQYTPEVEDPGCLSLITELCAYGRKLSPNLAPRGHEPFENPFEDYGLFAGALLGHQVETAIAHFAAKVDRSQAEETLPAQVLLHLLVRLGRYEEALEVSLRHLGGARCGDFCPSALQLCHMAGDYERLMALASERKDLLSYAAAALERRSRITESPPKM